jgi:hypothetical protein
LKIEFIDVQPDQGQADLKINPTAMYWHDKESGQKEILIIEGSGFNDILFRQIHERGHQMGKELSSSLFHSVADVRDGRVRIGLTRQECLTVESGTLNDEMGLCLRPRAQHAVVDLANRLMTSLLVDPSQDIIPPTRFVDQQELVDAIVSGRVANETCLLDENGEIVAACTREARNEEVDPFFLAIQAYRVLESSLKGVRVVPQNWEIIYRVPKSGKDGHSRAKRVAACAYLRGWQLPLMADRVG